jgi:hypothetical protein
MLLLRMSGAMRLLAIYAFMAWTGTALLFFVISIIIVVVMIIILHGKFGALTFIA